MICTGPRTSQRCPDLTCSGCEDHRHRSPGVQRPLGGYHSRPVEKHRLPGRRVGGVQLIDSTWMFAGGQRRATIGLTSSSRRAPQMGCSKTSSRQIPVLCHHRTGCIHVLRCDRWRHFACHRLFSASPSGLNPRNASRRQQKTDGWTCLPSCFPSPLAVAIFRREFHKKIAKKIFSEKNCLRFKKCSPDIMLGGKTTRSSRQRIPEMQFVTRVLLQKDSLPPGCAGCCPFAAAIRSISGKSRALVAAALFAAVQFVPVSKLR